MVKMGELAAGREEDEAAGQGGEVDESLATVITLRDLKGSLEELIRAKAPPPGGIDQAQPDGSLMSMSAPRHAPGPAPPSMQTTTQAAEQKPAPQEQQVTPEEEKKDSPEAQTSELVRDEGEWEALSGKSKDDVWAELVAADERRKAVEEARVAEAAAQEEQQRRLEEEEARLSEELRVATEAAEQARRQKMEAEEQQRRDEIACNAQEAAEAAGQLRSAPVQPARRS